MRMKYILILTLFISLIALSQDKDKPTGIEKKPKIEKEIQDQTDVKSTYVDKNNDGINDLLQKERRRKGHRHGQEQKDSNIDNKIDKFIDKDGDGICDFRQNGMGIKFRNKFGMKNRGQYGKQK